MRRTSIFCNIFDFNFLKIPNFYSIFEENQIRFNRIDHFTYLSSKIPV